MTTTSKDSDDGLFNDVSLLIESLTITFLVLGKVGLDATEDIVVLDAVGLETTEDTEVLDVMGFETTEDTVAMSLL